MGADIHWFTERFTSDTNYDGPRDLSEEREEKLLSILEDNNLEPRWVSADKWSFENEYDDEDPYWDCEVYYRDRNYKLFEILAGVRGDEDNAISLPRGIPRDASFGYKTMVKQWSSDGHSHSYYTLTELLEIDWDKYDNVYSNFDSIKNSLERMKSIDSNTDNVRAVFFFDN